MNRGTLLAVLIGTSLGTAAADDIDLARPPACARALELLDTREAAARQGGAAARAQLEAARKQAALACLGGPDAAASGAARAVSAPRAPVSPTVIGVPSAASSAAAAAPRVPIPLPTPSAVPRPAPPVTITSCDANGCFTSEGTRLQRVGPDTLLGPRGVCTVSGAIVNCPH